MSRTKNLFICLSQTINLQLTEEITFLIKEILNVGVTIL